MKKENYQLLLLLIMMYSGSHFAWSQERTFLKNDISVGYGIGTSNEILDLAEDTFSSLFTLGNYWVDRDYTGGFFLSYKRQVSKRIKVGGSFVYEYSSGTTFRKEDNTFKETGEVSANNYTIAAEGNYLYLNHTKFQLYSGIGAGVSFAKEKYSPNEPSSGSDDDSLSHFNFHLNAIGLRYGNKLGVFAEAGFGYKGIINMGASYRF